METFVLVKNIWRLYFLFFVVIAFGSSYFVINSSLTYYFFKVFFVSTLMVSIIGLHGFISKKQYFHRNVWRVVFVIILLNYIYEVYISINSPFLRESLISDLITMYFKGHFEDRLLIPLEACRYGFYLPLYYAIYHCGFKQ